jgi:hypothetical protein
MRFAGPIIVAILVGAQARADIIEDINANECNEELKVLKHIRGIDPQNRDSDYHRNLDRAKNAHEDCFQKAKRERREAAYQRQREARATEKAAEEARAEATRKDRKAMAAIFGAQFCLYAQIRRDALKEIAAEKKYARIGGVESRTKLYNLQQKIRWADEHEADERADMRRTFRGMTPLPCSRIEVLKILACVADECVDDETKHRASFITTEDSDDE